MLQYSKKSQLIVPCTPLQSLGNALEVLLGKIGLRMTKKSAAENSKQKLKLAFPQFLAQYYFKHFWRYLPFVKFSHP